MDADSHVIPRLAESWTLINNLTWEFKLRKGVKFHDGSEMTAEDVAWSMERPATIIGSPGKFDVYTKAIINKKIYINDSFPRMRVLPKTLLLP